MCVTAFVGLRLLVSFPGSATIERQVLGGTAAYTWPTRGHFVSAPILPDSSRFAFSSISTFLYDGRQFKTIVRLYFDR